MTNKRIFFCTEVQFPRGGAGANYLQYMALALIESGWEVIILGIGTNPKDDFKEEKYIHRGIEYYNISFPDNRIKKYIGKQFQYGKYLIPVLEKYKITSDDYFLFYTYRQSCINSLLKKYSFIDKNHFVLCCVEWLQPNQYLGGWLNPKYIEYRYTFNNVFTKINKIIPISNELNKFFTNKGCNTLIVPPMSDPFEFDSSRVVSNDKIRFIYSGAAVNKDSFNVMLEAMNSLTQIEKKRCELHLTNMTEDLLKNILGTKSYLINELGDGLVLHSWLEYGDLINLYRSTDYLLLAREKNLSTISNFPSKIPELLCYGVIPVCSDVGDCPMEYLKDGFDSIIFEGCTKEACLEAIRRAITIDNESKKLLSQNARKCSIEKFYYKKWAAQLNDFISS